MPNSRVRGSTDAWANILPIEIAALDRELASSINGDDGGCWSPSIPLVIGVAGLVSSSPLVLARGGTLTTSSDIATLVQPTIEVADTTYPYPTLNPRIYPVMSPCAGARGQYSYTWTVRREDGGLQAYSPMFDLGDGLGQRVSRAYLRIRAIDGATLTSVSVLFHVGWPHTALPSVFPSARVLRIDPFGNATPLTSQAAGGDAGGYVYVPKPSSPAAWTNQFGQQSFAIPCDQNNVVDLAGYSYLVELVEEQGLTGYPWQLTYTPPALVASTGSNLALSGAATIDTVSLNAGDLVLAKDQTDPTTNGLYVVNTGGSWPRSNLLSRGAQFSQGMVVPILFAGASNSGTVWQVQSSISTWTPNNPAATPNPGTPLAFLSKPDAAFPQEGSGFFGHGIVWQSVLATYSGIDDLRPQ